MLCFGLWTRSLCGSETARRTLLLLVCGPVVHTVLFVSPPPAVQQCYIICSSRLKLTPAASHRGCIRTLCVWMRCQGPWKKNVNFGQAGNEGLLIPHFYYTCPFSWRWVQNHGCLQGESALIPTGMNIMSPMTAAFFSSAFKCSQSAPVWPFLHSQHSVWIN